jgi:glycosyltransferase involved in cell wall biosynthesis
MAMRPFFSIIIPYHDSHDTIGPLLTSIAQSEDAPLLEVIVVDDGSTIPFKDLRSSVLGKNKKYLRSKTYDLRSIYLNANRGPAVARNKGAAIARGKFLVFLDGDVILFPDALHNLCKLFTDDPDVVAATGVWVKEQKSKAFFPNFKALRDWSYWINERDRSGYYFLFSTRIASVKKSVFLRLHGFDEKYAGPLVEDIEFTHRIARRYAVIFAQNVRVHHEFEGFWPIARKYFWRTFYWKRLYDRRKRFDPVATTGKEATTALTAIGALGCILLGIVFWIVHSQIYNLQFSIYKEISMIPACRQAGIFFFELSIFLLLLHIFLNRTFLLFAYREKGIIFAIKSFFVGIVLYCFIIAGALWAEVKKRL